VNFRSEPAPPRAAAPVARRVEHIGHGEFAQKVLASEEAVLVDFYADWCGPCRKLAPMLDQLARETPNARIVKVNIDHHPELADRYGVRSIPTLILFKNGKPTARRTGLMGPAALRAILNQ